jgi:putative membrane protein
MFLSALVAALHLVTLGIGVAGVWIRGRGFRSGDLATTFYGDNLWGIGAIAWLITGLARAFGGLEKGTDWYLHQPLFWVKMALFAGVVALEMWPMITLIRWRVRQARGQPIDLAVLPTFARINTIELALVLVIPFVAVGMARGMKP